MGGILETYIGGDASLLAQYAGAPASLFDAAPAAREWDPGLVAAIRRYNSDIGATATFEGNEAVIVTGQQPAVLGGPLYTVYKAITTIQAAREITERHGVPCVPIFWVGSEDHDFEEACTVHYLTKKHEVAQLRYEPTADIAGLPMYRVPMDDSLHEAIDVMARETRGSELSGEIVEFLHDSLSAASSLADWSARILARLFADTPLVFFAPHLPEARRLNADLIRREIEEPLATTRLLNGGGEALEKLGYAAQVVKNEAECNFFLEVEGLRRKVVFDGAAFQLPEEDKQFTQDKLLQLLDEAPECFSTNVALRCIAQQRLFPTAAYVAGPGELAYWGQLKGLFDHFDEAMPVVYPRIQAALSDMKCEKLHKKLNLDITAFAAHPDDVLATALRTVHDGPELDALRAAHTNFESVLNQLEADIKKKSPTAARMTETLQRDVERKWSAIERALLHEADGRDATVKQQVQRLCHTYHPLRKPQERVFTVFTFLLEHGWGLVPRLTKELDAERFDLQEVVL